MFRWVILVCIILWNSKMYVRHNSVERKRKIKTVTKTIVDSFNALAVATVAILSRCHLLLITKTLYTYLLLKRVKNSTKATKFIEALLEMFSYLILPSFLVNDQFYYVMLLYLSSMYVDNLTFILYLLIICKLISIQSWTCYTYIRCIYRCMTTLIFCCWHHLIFDNSSCCRFRSSLQIHLILYPW